MKSILVCLMMIKTSLALNGSYCCSGKEVIWVDDNGFNQCSDADTNTTVKITLKCFDNKTFIASNEYLPFRLKPDGSLGIMMGETVDDEIASVETGEFCLGHQTDDGGVVSVVVLMCQGEMEPEVVSQEVQGYCMAVSSVFLALTAFVYLAFPELRDLQGKSITSLCGTQAIATALLCVLKVMVYSHMTWCAVRGFLAYYFTISSFFWMNAIALQILINIKHSSTSKDSWWKFMWYALYAWGMPAVLTTALIITNYHPGTHTRPGIGYNQCWFLDTKRTWIFMYSVLAVLMAANAAIFIYSSVFLWKHKFSSSHLQALRYKFWDMFCLCRFCDIFRSWMMFRLFIIMGLPWIFEMVTSLTPAHTIWVIIDLINCLQGILVFLILVVFRRRVIKVLHGRNALFCLSGAAGSYLKGADDEEDIVTPTAGVPMEETGHTQP